MISRLLSSGLMAASLAAVSVTDVVSAWSKSRSGTNWLLAGGSHLGFCRALE